MQKPSPGDNQCDCQHQPTRPTTKHAWLYGFAFGLIAPVFVFVSQAIPPDRHNVALIFDPRLTLSQIMERIDPAQDRIIRSGAYNNIVVVHRIDEAAPLPQGAWLSFNPMMAGGCLQSHTSNKPEGTYL